MRISLLAACLLVQFLGVSAGTADEVPNLSTEDKRYDAATGTVEFTLVNRHGSPAVAWGLRWFSSASSGGEAKVSLLEDREPFLDPERWASEPLPEQAFVPAHGRLRQRLKIQPDGGDFAAVLVEVQAVLYEDGRQVGDRAVLDRVFRLRLARFLETRAALEALGQARVSGGGATEAFRTLESSRYLERASVESLDAEVAADRQGTRDLLRGSLFQASISEDQEISLDFLEEIWTDRVRRLAAGLRPSDREKWSIRADGAREEQP